MARNVERHRIEETVSKCRTCQKYRNAQTKEPLEQHEVPEKPWTKVVTDLLHFRGKEYLLVCDYFTKFFEICEMEKSAASEVVIRKLKNIFARYGVPLTLISDNGIPAEHSRILLESGKLNMSPPVQNLPNQMAS